MTDVFAKKLNNSSKNNDVHPLEKIRALEEKVERERTLNKITNMIFFIFQPTDFLFYHAAAFHAFLTFCYQRLCALSSGYNISILQKESIQQLLK